MPVCVCLCMVKFKNMHFIIVRDAELTLFSGKKETEIKQSEPAQLLYLGCPSNYSY